MPYTRSHEPIIPIDDINSIDLSDLKRKRVPVRWIYLLIRGVCYRLFISKTVRTEFNVPNVQFP